MDPISGIQQGEQEYGNRDNEKGNITEKLTQSVSWSAPKRCFEKCTFKNTLS